MKFLFLFFFVSFLLVDFLSSASPREESLSLPEQPHEELLAHSDAEVLSRAKRATCPWFPSACEVHCRSKGFSTGFCRGGTCTCKNY